ncbi:MAG: hypothetical protein ACYC5O_14865 [Anaerolineae bacterium]
MVRKPKRRKQTGSHRRWQMTVLYVISILVVLSMAIGLALSVSNSGSPALPPESAALMTLLLLI